MDISAVLTFSKGVRYRAQTDVHGAPIRLRIEKALGVSADLKRIEISDVDAVITIQ